MHLLITYEYMQSNYMVDLKFKEIKMIHMVYFVKKSM